MFGFGRARGRRVSRDVQDQLDALSIEKARIGINERIQRNQLLHAAAQRDPVAAAQIAFGRRNSAGAVPIATREPLGERVVAALIDKVLSEREDDPALKIARLRRAAIEDRALRRVMEADDDDDGGQDGGGMMREIVVALAAAVGTSLAPALAQYAPQVAARLQTGAAPSPSPAPAVDGAVPSPHRLGSGAGSSSPPSLDPSGGTPMQTPSPESNVSPFLGRLKTRFVLRQLEASPPEAFARWVVGQDAARPMLDELIATPDAELPQLLAEALEDPDLAEWRDVLQWLADHPPETLAIVCEARRLLGGREPSSAEPLAEPRRAAGGW